MRIDSFFWKAGRNRLYLFLILILGAAIRLSFLENSLRYPDSMHYAYGAECLLKYGRYAIPVNGFFTPPQYPFGLPLIISVSYIFLGISEEAARLTVASFGVTGILLVYLFTKELLESEAAGLVSALFLSLSSLHWFYSTTVMSDVVNMFFGTASLYLLLKAAKTGDKRFFILSGLLMGYSISVHLSNMLFYVVALIFLLYSKGLKFLRSVDFELFCVSSLVAMVPFLAYTRWLYNTFGVFFGYQMWMGPESFARAFSLNNVFPNLAFLLQVLFWPSVNLPNEHYLLLSAPASFFFLAGYVFLLWKKRLLEAVLLTVWLAVFLTFFLIFYVPDTRYLLPALPAFIALASYGLIRIYCALAERIEKANQKALTLPKIFIIASLLVIALPSTSVGYSLIETRHSQPNPDKMMAVWVRDNLPKEAIVINGAGEYVIYYCQRYDIYGWRSIHVIHAVADIPSVINYLSEEHKVYAVFDAVTQALYVPQFDELMRNFNFTFFGTVPGTNIVVYRVYRR